MKSQEFTLKSGAKLHVTRAPFAISVVIYETVVELSRETNPEDAISALVSNAKVREVVMPAMDFVLYEGVRHGVHLFDDPKLGERAYSDYVETLADVIQVNVKPFFLLNSSKSTEPLPPPSSSPKQP